MMSIMSSFLIVKFTAHRTMAQAFYYFLQRSGWHMPIKWTWFFVGFFLWSLESLRYSSSDSCPHPPLPTFMNGCLQIIKVGVTFRGVLDQGLDSKIEAWDWNIVLWYSGDRQACSPLGIFWLLEVYWFHF